MSVKRLKLSQPDSTEIKEIIFPEEVWILIWSYLDFKTIQKTCTQVSKSWLEMIRSSKLSWEMRLQHRFSFFKLDLLEVEDFNAILDHWKNLRVIHFTSELEFARFQLSLKTHKSLKKIVISSGPILYNKECMHGCINGCPLGDPCLHGCMNGCPLGDVTKYWIDPEHLLAPTDAIKNVITIEKMDLDGFCEEFAVRQNDWDLTTLETLKISYRSYYKTAVPKPELSFRFKNLKKLEISNVRIGINELLDILNFLGNTKNVKISASLEVLSDLSEEETKDIFNQALQMVKEQFPFPNVRILDLEIFESMNTINYGESGATLTTTDPDSEMESSDFEIWPEQI